ncbi:MAG: DUF2314 domain-containing protein, partial [Leptospiraceae bacterium]|nr:DUF2314 domain-containing protein [Leptospiraceae bacterium]
MKPLKTKPRFGLAEPAGWTIGLSLLSLIGGAFLPKIAIITIPLGIIYLAIGIGAWQENRKAAAAGMWVFLIAVVMRAASFAVFPFSWGKAAHLLLWGWIAWEYRQALKRWETESDEEADSKPLISIALLLKTPRYLEEAILAQIVQSAWGGNYTEGDDDDRDGFVVGKSPIFMVKCPQGMFLVHNHQTPYFYDIEETAGHFREKRLRHAIQEHQAWIAVDLITPFDTSLPREEYYPLIIRLIYELADEDVMAVFRPETGQINIWADDVLEALLMPQGEDQFNQVTPHPPVIPVSADDPEMIAAVTEAKRRWPEFLQAFQMKKDGDHFSIKAPVTSDGVTEYIWIEVTGLERDYIHGLLGNEPVALEGFHLGSVVEIPVS